MKSNGTSRHRLRTRLVAVAIVLLITAHRLPAPIVEAPTPAPAAKSTPKAKKEERARKPTPSKPTISSFVGTWTGTVSGAFTSDIGLNTSGNVSRTVRISSNGSVVWFGQSIGGQAVPQYTSRAAVSKDGRTVSWIQQQNEQGGVLRGTFSLQLIAPNAANYQENGSFSSSEANFTIKASGTLTKQ